MRYHPPRAGVRADCCHADDTPHSATVLGLVELSAEGVHVRLDAAPQPGSAVLIRLGLPEGPVYLFPGEVAWVVADRGGSGFSAGIRFDECLPRDTLRVFVEMP